MSAGRRAEWRGFVRRIPGSVGSSWRCRTIRKAPKRGRSALAEKNCLAACSIAWGDEGVHALHDRRIPKTKANIDHIAVAPSGIFVIDAKRYKGRPRLQVDGGLFRPRTERMFVGSRDCTKLVTGVQWQVELVRTALSGHGVTAPILGKLCFVDADWPLIGGAFTIGGVEALWPKALRKQLAQPGPLTPEMLRDLHRHIADAFPPA